MYIAPDLVEATVEEGYRVHVCFADGLSATIDLSYLCGSGGVFEPLRDPDYFSRLRVDDIAGTIIWPNEADIAPETLYELTERAADASGPFSVPAS